MNNKQIKEMIVPVLEEYFGEISSFTKQTMDVYEVASYLNLSVSYVRKLTSRKEIPHHKPFGKKLYFIKSEIDEGIRNSKRWGRLAMC